MSNIAKRFFPALLLGITMMMQANPVDTQTALKVAVNFWKSNPLTAKVSAELEVTDIAADNGFSNFYIMRNTLGDGFVIVSADDCVQPILAYSATDGIGDSDLPATTKVFLSSYNRQIEYCIGHKSQANADTQRLWDKYLSGKDMAYDKGAVVGPLVQTKWNQMPIYNGLCPHDRTIGFTASGCTAIAMAQAMKYWNHPAVGSGSNSYTHETYGTLSANFDNTHYDWAHMPVRLDNSSGFTERNAIQTLVLHCGISVNMDYGESSSASVHGSDYTSSEYAFKTFFGYKDTIHSEYRGDFTDSAWAMLLKSELDARRIVVYTGFDYTDTNDISGHAFICDGYDNTGKYHFNWGWGGNYDGYFELSYLYPGMSFDSVQQALVYMEPDSDLLMVTPTTLEIAGEGGSGRATVTAASDSVGWTANANSPWITVSPASGAGLGASSNITISVAANNGNASRIGTVTISQDNQFKTIYIEQPALNHMASGWYGNTSGNDKEEFTSTDMNMVIIRPESYGNFSIGDKITHVKFKPVNEGTFLGRAYYIKIFKNIDYSVLATGECDSSTALGRATFTQSYNVENLNTEQEVVLTTPYEITSSPFWIVLQAQSPSKIAAKVSCTSVPESDMPRLSDISGHYLRGYRSGHVCPAVNFNRQENQQCNVEYYFAFKVQLGNSINISDPEESRHTLRLYPNPTRNSVNFSSTVNRVEVYDNAGRKIMSCDNTESIDISGLKAGFYALRITTDNGILVKKVIKQQ